MLLRMFYDSNVIPHSKILYIGMYTQNCSFWKLRKKKEWDVKKKGYIWFFIHIHNICVQHWHMIVIKFYCFPFGGFEYCSYCTEKLQKCVD